MTSSATRKEICGTSESMSSIQAVRIACEPLTTSAMSAIVTIV